MRTTFAADWRSVAATAAPPAAGRTKTPLPNTLLASRASLKVTSISLLMSTPSLVSPGTVDTTCGCDSSSTMSPKSPTSPLAAIAPRRNARPPCSLSDPCSDHSPCGTGARENRPSSPTICRIAPCNPLREGNATAACVPAATVLPSPRNIRPTKVPLAVNKSSRLRFAPTPTSATVSAAAKPKRLALNCTVSPTGRLVREKAPSSPTTSDSAKPEAGSSKAPLLG